MGMHFNIYFIDEKGREVHHVDLPQINSIRSEEIYNSGDPIRALSEYVSGNCSYPEAIMAQVWQSIAVYGDDYKIQFGLW